MTEECPNCKSLRKIIDSLTETNSFLEDNGNRWRLQAEAYERKLREHKTDYGLDYE